MQSGNYGTAIGIWNQLITAEPEYVIALNNRGYCNLMLGNFSAAVEDYLKADAISQNLDSKAGVQWAYLADEKYGDSIQWGKAALTIDPNNFWVRRRLASAYDEQGDGGTAEKFYSALIDEHGARSLTHAPAGQLIPFYQGVNFSGSQTKTSGYDAGAFALWNFNSGVTLGGGYAQSSIGNPTSTTAYETKEFKLMSGFLFSDLSHLTLTGHFLSSNYGLLDRAFTLTAAYKPSIYSRFTISADALVFSDHGGAQITPQYMLPLARGLSLGLGATAQVIGFSQVAVGEPSRTVNFYGAAQASLHYCFSVFCASAGGLYGSLYTPLSDNGATLTYILDELQLSGFARLAFKPSAYVEISAAYTYGRWKAINGDTPASGTFSFAATGSLF